MLLDDSPATRALLVAGSGEVCTVGDVRRRADELAGRHGLTFLEAGRSLRGALDFLALLEAGRPVALIDPASDARAIHGLVEAYGPERVLTTSDWHLDGYDEAGDGTWVRPGDSGPLHDDLAVLLTTSGTTGSPKLVRLSKDNVRTNARQIAEALALGPADRGVSSMPLHYSFGMSVLTSHAVSGGSVLVHDHSVIEPAFWDAMADHAVTVLGGVPTTYGMLKRLGFAMRELPALRQLIQAGGRLDPSLAETFHAEMQRRGGEFTVMYGQTEASPRMSTLASSDFVTRPGSVGRALAGGRLSVRDDAGNDLPAGVAGRVLYTGPNVMMGYATGRADLALGDEHGATLDTGDLGYLDEDGYLFLTGRSSRFCKLSGSRVSLDEAEDLAAGLMPDADTVAAVSPADDSIVLVAVGPDEARAPDLRRAVANALRVPPKLVSLHIRDSVPLTARGKVDYSALEREVTA